MSGKDQSTLTKLTQVLERTGIKSETSSAWQMGVRGSKLLDQLLVKVHIAPLRRSRYSGKNRVGSTIFGYRLTLELESSVPVRFSVTHAGINGAKLIAWVNHLKGLHRVPHVVTDLYQYAVWSSDADWARQLLDQTEVNTAIAKLLECEPVDAKVGQPCVFVWPGKIAFYRRAASHEGFNRLENHLQDIATVHRVAHNIPPPSAPASNTYLERSLENNPMLVGCFIVISGLMIVAALFGGLLWWIL